MQPFRYLDLPPEIRNMILLLTRKLNKRIQQQPTYRKDTPSNDGLRFSTPLLATNHQTQEEGLAILFSKNILGLDLIPGDVSLPPWIKHPNHQTLLLTRLVDLHIFPRKCSRLMVNETTIPLVAQTLRSCETLESVKITVFHNPKYYKSSFVADIHSIARYFCGIRAKMEICLCDTSANEGDEVWISWNRADASLSSAPMVRLAHYHVTDQGTAGWVYEVEGLRAAEFTDLRISK